MREAEEKAGRTVRKTEGGIDRALQDRDREVQLANAEAWRDHDEVSECYKSFTIFLGIHFRDQATL